MTSVIDPRKLFVAWLRNVSTCHFARTFASKEVGIVVGKVEGGTPTEWAEAFELAFSASRTGEHAFLCVLPLETSPRKILELTHALTKRPGTRWHLAALPNADSLELRLKFTPSEDEAPSAAMGFGPFHTMPATRRAPVAAIGIWASGFKNPFFDRVLEGKPRKSVSFADMPHGMLRKVHDATWKKTTADSEALVGEVHRLRPMTFRLPV